MDFKKILAAALAASILTGGAGLAAYADNVQTVRHEANSYAQTASGINVAGRTEAEIRAYVQNHPFDTKASAVYSQEPSLDSPYNAGELSSKTLGDALNALNCIRYIAGLDEVTLNDSYNELAQAASFVNAKNNGISHYPAKPAGIPDSLYNTGAAGASSSNLGIGYNNPADSILRGYMKDSDSSNIDRVGHRRWCLHPSMTQTGFGQVQRCTAMYAFDNTFGATDKYGVCWPAQNTPIEYFGENWAWSISMGSYVDSSAVKVTLKRRSDNKTWTFSSARSDGYFNVENSNYGQKGCIIFRPDGLDKIMQDDVFSVEIAGLGTPVSYNVRFFYLDPPLSTYAKGEARYLIYTEKEDGTLRVACSYDSRDLLNNLVIPSELNGKKVTEISASAFNGCKNLKTICIPKGITKMGYNVFYDCAQLEKIYFGGTKQEWTSAGGKSDVTYSENGIKKVKTAAVYYSSACPVPSKPKYSKTSSSITLSWEKVEGASSYVVKYSSDGKKWTTKTVSANKIKLTGLKSNQKYYFKIAAKSSDGMSAYTSTYSVVTKKAG